MTAAIKIRELETEDFHLDSTNWKALKDARADGRHVKINPFGDVFEITLDGWTPVQLFTHAAAMRETQAAGKKMPSRMEFLASFLQYRFANTGCLVGEGFEDVGDIGYYWTRRASSTATPGFRISSDFRGCFEVFDYDRSFCFAVRCLRE